MKKKKAKKKTKKVSRLDRMQLEIDALQHQIDYLFTKECKCNSTIQLFSTKEV